jgi:hypothetical protein
MTTEMKPVYQHDCDKCKFLGTIKTKDNGYGEQHDVYWCSGTLGSLLARYGNEGWEYASFMIPDHSAGPLQTIRCYKEQSDHSYVQAMALLVKSGHYRGDYSAEFPESLINLVE